MVEMLHCARNRPSFIMSEANNIRMCYCIGSEPIVKKCCVMRLLRGSVKFLTILTPNDLWLNSRNNGGMATYASSNYIIKVGRSVIRLR